MDNNGFTFSVILLTYNREKYLKLQIPLLSKLADTEIIIVDNNSETDYAAELSSGFNNITCIKLDKNYGAVGRNFGMQIAKGKYIITLDDDVWGIEAKHLNLLHDAFQEDTIAAICFKVLDEKTQAITNWCHPCDPIKFSNVVFDTHEISEGAVAFKREIFDRIGYYPLEFFISHEGPDLAFRILNIGKRILYNPNIEVIHAHAIEGRKNWRRYYYDTRNLLWLAYRNYNGRMLLTQLPLKLMAMFLYSIRDGFVKYYLKAILDGIAGIKHLKGTRVPITHLTYKKMQEMDKNKPSIFYYIKKRLFTKGVKI
jgi:GT2 family glycosyltransferase